MVGTFRIKEGGLSENAKLKMQNAKSRFAECSN
jgi:hypothetical protein